MLEFDHADVACLDFAEFHEARRAELVYIQVYFTYILKSKVTKRTYTGHTQNIQERLKLHNEGKVTYTSKYRPWSLIYSEAYRTKRDAIKREKYFKSAAGRRWMRKYLFEVD